MKKRLGLIAGFVMIFNASYAQSVEIRGAFNFPLGGASLECNLPSGKHIQKGMDFRPNLITITNEKIKEIGCADKKGVSIFVKVGNSWPSPCMFTYDVSNHGAEKFLAYEGQCVQD